MPSIYRITNICDHDYIKSSNFSGRFDRRALAPDGNIREALIAKYGQRVPGEILYTDDNGGLLLEYNADKGAYFTPEEIATENLRAYREEGKKLTRYRIEESYTLHSSACFPENIIGFNCWCSDGDEQTINAYSTLLEARFAFWKWECGTTEIKELPRGKFALTNYAIFEYEYALDEDDEIDEYSEDCSGLVVESRLPDEITIQYQTYTCTTDADGTIHIDKQPDQDGYYW